jgi:hypothetical protein
MKPEIDKRTAIALVAQDGRFHLIASPVWDITNDKTLPLGSVACEVTAQHLWRALHRKLDPEPWQR